MDRDYPVAARRGSLGVWYSGVLKGRRDRNFHSFTVEGRSLLHISYSATGEVWVRVVRRNGTLLGEMWGKNGERWMKTEGGTVYVCFEAVAEGLTRYHFRLSSFSDGGDAADSPSEAAPLKGRVEGVVCGWVDEDWFFLGEEGVYRCQLEGEGVFFTVYDENGKRVEISHGGNFLLKGNGWLVVREEWGNPSGYSLLVRRVGESEVDIGFLEPGEWREIRLLAPFQRLRFKTEAREGLRLQVKVLSGSPVLVRVNGEADFTGFDVNQVFFPYDGELRVVISSPWCDGSVRLFIGVCDLQ